MKTSTKIKSWFKKDWNETKTLFRCLPALPFAVLCGALIAMNILANKGVAFTGIFGDTVGGVVSKFFSADTGIIVSWIGFLAADTIVKIFGVKASIKVNLAAILVQLMTVGILACGALIPGEFNNGLVNTEGFNSIFIAQTWPLFAGTFAFIIATIVNSILSDLLLKKFKDRTSFKSYAVASYISTMLGQFLDNMLFGLFFSMWQGWFTETNTFSDVFIHLIGISAVGMIVELLCQVLLSPVGHKLTKAWRENGVGKEYIDLVEDAKEVNMSNAVIETTRFSIKKFTLSIISFISIVSSCGLAIWNRLTNFDLVREGNDSILSSSSPLSTPFMIIVYALAGISIICYIASYVAGKSDNSALEE